jgi:NAD(P)-dependent dehydrogenase (short-subunit alcohol dehydrogenase family)
MVTGGSSGIGFELANQFAEHGYDVAISGHSDRVFGSAEKLRALGAEAYPVSGRRGHL